MSDPESGLPTRRSVVARQKTSAPLRTMLEPRLTVRQSFFDPYDTRAHRIYEREKRASTRVPRAYICRRGGGRFRKTATRKEEEGGRRGTRTKGGRRRRRATAERKASFYVGPIQTFLPKVTRPRGFILKSLFSAMLRRFAI